MMVTHIKISNLDPDHPGPVNEEVVEIDVRGRIFLPKRIISNMKWVGKPHSKCLMVLEEVGRIALLPWDPYGLDVLKRRRELIEEYEDNEEVLRALSFLEHRYHPFRISSEGRPTLKAQALVHLRFLENKNRKIYLIVFPKQIELVTQNYWDKVSKYFPTLLEGLP